MASAFLLLGSNLGKREEVIQKACLMIAEKMKIVASSSLYVSEPWGIKDQPTFLNQVLKVETFITPYELLKHCLSIEVDLGRVRHSKWGERLIDIDILYYEDQIIDEKDLIIPHPGIPDRRFTLVPLYELEPAMIHPVLKKTQEQLLKECPDILLVEPYVFT